MAKKYVGYSNIFCPHCGARREKGARKCPDCGKNYSIKVSMKNMPALGSAGVGWTPYADDRSLKRHVNRVKTGTLIFMILVSFVIFVAIIISTPNAADNLSKGSWMIALPPLGLIWVFWLVWLYLQYRNARGWEGIVDDKDTQTFTKRQKDAEGHYYTNTSTSFNVYFTDTRGKKHKLVQSSPDGWYGYLDVGDRVRYHGKSTNYYEKYDKSKLEFIPCAGCGCREDARATYCTTCGSRLFKRIDGSSAKRPYSAEQSFRTSLHPDILERYTISPQDIGAQSGTKILVHRNGLFCTGTIDEGMGLS